MGNGLVKEQRWKVTGASVRGSSHDKLGLPCQDAHSWRVLPEDILVAAVADGAGSARLADIGAATAVKQVIEHVSSLLSRTTFDQQEAGWEKLLVESVTATKADLQLAAQMRSVPVSDLATTLLVVVAGPDFVAGIQIGDGAIVLAESEQSMVCIGRPTQGEYLNETSFLTSVAALDAVVPVIRRGAVSDFAIFSDGLQMAALHMPEAEPHPGFFVPLFRFSKTQNDVGVANAELVNFLESPRLRERTDDDVTLLLAHLAS
jgi:hypothetical protein